MTSGKGKRQRKQQKKYDIFLGCFVNVILKGIKGRDNNSQVVNLTISGILLDETNDCLYLGNETEVNTVIDKDVVALVIAETVDLEIPLGTIQQ